MPIIIIGVIAAVIVAGVVGVTLHANRNFSVSIIIDGEDYSLKSEEGAKKALAKKYPWSLTVTNGEATYEAEDLKIAVFNNMLVLGCRGDQKIFGIRLS